MAGSPCGPAREGEKTRIMLKELSVISLLALALVSCTRSTAYTPDPDIMQFSAVASHTDASASSAHQLKSGIITTTNYPVDVPFVVEAVLFDPAQGVDSGSSFMSSEKLSYSSEEGKWKPEEEHFWPEKGNLLFYAGSPILPNVSVGVGNGVTADWSIPTEADTQVDLCFAKVIERCESHSTAVPFVFRHALTQVCIKARTLKQYSYSRSENNYIQSNVIKVVLDSVKIGGILSKGHFTQEPAKWVVDNDSAIQYPVFCSESGLELGCNRYDSPVLNELTKMLLLPQTLSPDAAITEWHHIVIRSSITDTTTGEILSDETYTLPKSSVLPLKKICDRWVMDYKYTFRIAVGLEDSEITVAVTDWTETKEIVLGDE